MSDVTRYMWTATGLRPSEIEHGPVRFIRETDYDALRATVERLEAERQTFIDALWEYGHDVHGQHTGVRDGRCGLCSAYDSYVAASNE